MARKATLEGTLSRLKILRIAIRNIERDLRAAGETVESADLSFMDRHIGPEEDERTD